MPPTVDSSFLSKAVNRLLSFNLVPERFHIPDIVYPLFSSTMHGEHRFISDSRHIYAFICWQKKFKCEDLSMATKFFTWVSIYSNFTSSPGYHQLEIFLFLRKFLAFAFDSGSGIFNYACFFFFSVFFSVLLSVSPCLVLSKFLNPEEPRHPFCHFSWWQLWRRSWLCSGRNKQFDHPRWFAQVWLFSKKEKSLWEPIQIILWLGLHLNTIDRSIRAMHKQG